MRTENVLISLMALVIGSLCVVSALIIFVGECLQYSILEQLCHLMQRHVWALILSLLVAGSALLGLCAYACRRSYLHVEMHDYSLQDSVIKDLAQEQLKALFLDQPCQCEVVVHQAKNIEIFADLPFVAPTLQTRKLRQVEKTLTKLLKKQAHFNHSFLLHANFRDQ